MSLKVLFYSTIPSAGVGYGNAMRNIIRRFKADGHECELATKHHIGMQMVIDNILCWDGGELELVNVIKRAENFDYVVSMMDDWIIPVTFKFDDWINCVMCDTHLIHPRLLDACGRALKTIAPTKFSESELKRNNMSPLYAPIGVDTNIFKPDPEKRKEFRKVKNWPDDKFIVGSLGINYINDRKNFIGLLRAFKIFHERHPDTILYMHTDVLGSATGGIALKWVIREMGFPDDSSGAVQYVNQENYHRWNISEETIVRTFNSFDVFCFPTMGEGFGMPIIEAQACGTPVIVTNTTSGKELLKSGWLIEPDEDDFEFSTHLTWIVQPKQSAILDKLEAAYSAWKDGSIKEMGKQAREEILTYDWDIVYKEYWRPVFEWMEKRKDGKIIEITHYPDWKKLYNMFGILFQGTDCEKKFDHKLVCHEIDFPRLPSEPEDDPRPILLRSYPIFPDADGKLYVHQECPVHGMLSSRFVDECKRVFDEILSYPRIREAIKKLWDEDKILKPYVPLDSLIHEFDDKYAEIFQTMYKTTFKMDEKVHDFIKDSKTVLDVGCGDGWMVKGLNERGVQATGLEINKTWVNGQDIIYGSVDKIPFPDNSFDTVFCIDVLEHVKDPIKGLAELFRVAKKRLVLVCTPTSDAAINEDPTHVTKWSTERWKREINEFGEIVMMPNYHGIFFVEKR